MSEQFPIDTDTEVGDDDALHSFWALSKEQIESLAALDEGDRAVLALMQRQQR